MKNLATLGDVLLEIQAGKSFQTSEILARPDELGVLKVSAVTWTDFRPEEAKALSDAYEPAESHKVKNGDFIISRANTKEFVGAVVLVEGDYPNRLLSDKTLRLVVDENHVCKEYLLFALRSSMARKHIELFATGTSDSMRNISQDVITSIPLPLPRLMDQRRIGLHLKANLAEVEKARQAALTQLSDVSKLADALIAQSLNEGATDTHHLGEVLTEVKQGIGKNWQKHAVLGATREGLAPAKEPPGKHAVKYKPVSAGTVFYNPMRILIGSIAFVDEDDTPGITSPDYVVLRGCEDVVDSRWFYYWLRSPLGVQCINSLARGAVRERMLFNRLAEGEIVLPDYRTQKRASAALKELNCMRIKLKQQLDEIALLPQKILSQAFES
jgi:type I restriction enzyme, S subunit